MRSRRAAAYQAWWEHQPVRVPRAQSWADLTITRTVDWGGLARFFMLDGRQFRSDQACGDGARVVPCGDWAEPDAHDARTGAGAVAHRRARRIARAVAGARQPNDGRAVRFAGRVPRCGWRWTTGAATRRRATGCSAPSPSSAPNRTVVITGDIHSNWVNELHAGFSRPTRRRWRRSSWARASRPAAMATDGRDWRRPRSTRIRTSSGTTGAAATCRAPSPPDAWTAEYRVVPFVSRPDAPTRRRRPGGA